MAEIAELALIVDSSGAAKGIKRIEDRLNRLGEKAPKQTKKVESGFERIKKSVFSLKGALISIGALAFLKNAISQASDFEKKMAEVNTLVDDTFAFDKMKKSVENLSIAFGSSAIEQAGAAYQVISAGATSASQATATLTAANELALGGVTDITTAVDGLTSTLNAYGPSVGSATSVSDRFFIAVKAGKTTVAELSQSIGLVAPVAANLGISLDEVLAATAALTKGGISTAISMRGLRQVMANVLKPTSEAKDVAKRLGIEFNAAAIQSKGLQGFLKDVIDKTKGSTEELGLLFGSVESLVPILALAGNAGEDFEKILDDMAKSGGATAEAVKKMKNTFDFKFAVFKQGALAVIRDLGTKMLPVLSNVIDSISKLAKFVKDNATAFKFLAGILISFKAAAFLGPMISGIGISLVKTTVKAYGFASSLTAVSATSRIATGTLGALRGVMALLGGPAGLIIAAAGALASWALSSNSSEDATKALNTEVETLLGNYKDLEESRLKEVIDKQTEAIEKQKTAVQDLVSANTAGGGPVGNINGIRDASAEYGRLVAQLDALKLKLEELKNPTENLKSTLGDSTDSVQEDTGLGIGKTELENEQKRNDFLLESQRQLLTDKELLEIEFRSRKDELENVSVLGTIQQQQSADAILLNLDIKHKKDLEKLEIKHQKNKSKTKSLGVKFAEQLRDRDFKGALGTAQALTQGIARTNKTAFRINKAASIGSALINSYEGFTSALKLPFPYNIAAAGVTLAAGIAQVNAIRSTSFGSGGGGGGASFSAPSFAGSGGGLPSGVSDPPPTISGEISSGSVDTEISGPTQIDINLGDDDDLISKSAVRKLIEKINVELGDGVRLNV